MIDAFLVLEWVTKKKKHGKNDIMKQSKKKVLLEGICYFLNFTYITLDHFKTIKQTHQGGGEAKKAHK